MTTIETPEIEEAIARVIEKISTPAEEFLGKLLGGKEEASIDISEDSGADTAPADTAETTTTEPTLAERLTTLDEHISAFKETLEAPLVTGGPALDLGEAVERLESRLNASESLEEEVIKLINDRRRVVDGKLEGLPLTGVQLDDLEKLQSALDRYQGAMTPLLEAARKDEGLSFMTMTEGREERRAAIDNLKQALSDVQVHTPLKRGNG